MGVRLRARMDRPPIKRPLTEVPGAQPRMLSQRQAVRQDAAPGEEERGVQIHETKSHDSVLRLSLRSRDASLPCRRWLESRRALPFQLGRQDHMERQDRGRRHDIPPNQGSRAGGIPCDGVGRQRGEARSPSRSILSAPMFRWCLRTVSAVV